MRVGLFSFHPVKVSHNATFSVLPYDTKFMHCNNDINSSQYTHAICDVINLCSPTDDGISATGFLGYSHTQLQQNIIERPENVSLSASSVCVTTAARRPYRVSILHNTRPKLSVATI